jgi:hypothetical protein
MGKVSAEFCGDKYRGTITIEERRLRRKCYGE